MASEDKKYSLISVDTGVAEEEAGVRTRREVVDGEETIVVSSAAPVASEPTETASDSGRVAASQGDRARSDADPVVFSGSEELLQDDDASDDDQIPFQRMQGIIIVCLIVLIVAFLVYFNFIR